VSRGVNDLADFVSQEIGILGSVDFDDYALLLLVVIIFAITSCGFTSSATFRMT